MLALSQGASLAWHLAAGEATHTGQSYIETAEVFIGICRLGTWLRAHPAGKSKLVAESRGGLGVQTEADAVEEVLRAFTLSPDRLRHTVRAARTGGKPPPAQQTPRHRSSDCKAVFQQAEVIAAATCAGEVHCLHLLGAILEHPGAFLARVLALFLKDVHAAQTRALASAARLDRQLADSTRKSGVSHLIYRPAGLQ
jgi:hypothetical protein